MMLDCALCSVRWAMSIASALTTLVFLIRATPHLNTSVVAQLDPGAMSTNWGCCYSRWLLADCHMLGKISQRRACCKVLLLFLAWRSISTIHRQHCKMCWIAHWQSTPLRVLP